MLSRYVSTESLCLNICSFVHFSCSVPLCFQENKEQEKKNLMLTEKHNLSESDVCAIVLQNFSHYTDYFIIFSYYTVIVVNMWTDYCIFV